MRDLVMLVTFLVLLIPAIKKPFIAVSLWLWTALFFPGGWVYGIAGSIRYNLIFSIITIIGVFGLKNRPKSESDPLSILITIFFIWTFITFLAGQVMSPVAQDYWVRFFKIVLLYYCAIAILTKKYQIDFFVWCIVLSVGFFAAVEGLKLIASGGGHHVTGFAGHVLGDRNDLAMGINMSIPLAVYLRSQSENRIIKQGLLGVVVLMVLSVLGTYSRGGLVGLVVLALVFFKSSNNKIFAIPVIVAIAYIGYNLMPEEWFKRMDTIQHAGQDGSFMGRVVAWKIATLIALDSPILGAGIKGPETYSVWISYALKLGSELTFIDTPPPDLKGAHAAHSTFFQVLGEQGFVGLFIFILILLVAYAKLGVCTRLTLPDSPFHQLAKMLKLSLIMYIVSALALSKAYFDLSFSIYALCRVLERHVKTERNRPKMITPPEAST